MEDEWKENVRRTKLMERKWTGKNIRIMQHGIKQERGVGRRKIVRRRKLTQG